MKGVVVISMPGGNQELHPNLSEASWINHSWWQESAALKLGLRALLRYVRALIQD